MMQTAELPVYRFDRFVAKALVDLEDLPRLDGVRWLLGAQGYVHRKIWRNRQQLYIALAREVMDVKPRQKVQVDHRNRNKLDNRKANLRIVTSAENHQNRPSVKGSSSRFRGVTWHREAEKWQVQMMVKGRSVYLGLHEDEETAGAIAAAYRAAHMPFSPEAVL